MKLLMTPLAMLIPKFRPKTFALFPVFVMLVIVAMTTVKAVTVNLPLINDRTIINVGSTT